MNCRDCGVPRPSNRSGRCPECARSHSAEYAAAYYPTWKARNLEAWADYQRTYYLGHRAVKIAYATARNGEHRGESNAAITRWKRTHRDRLVEYEARRRSRVRGCPPLSPENVADKMAYWGNKCWICGGAAGTVDHVKPIAAGGAHLLCNLRPACQSCNSTKGKRWPLLERVPRQGDWPGGDL